MTGIGFNNQIKKNTVVGFRFRRTSDVFVTPFKSSDAGLWLASKVSSEEEYWHVDEVSGKYYPLAKHIDKPLNPLCSDQEWYMTLLVHTQYCS